MTEDELKKLILEYLEKNKLMTVATADNNIPWAATVFFAFDQGLNLYFISREDRRHSQEIIKNPVVAITINQDFGKPGKVKGVQIQGEAAISEDRQDLDKFIKRFAWAQKFLDSHKLFKIKPTFIRYLDDEKFGPGQIRELNLN